MLSCLLGRDLGDDRDDLRRADVESDDEILGVLDHACFPLVLLPELHLRAALLRARAP